MTSKIIEEARAALGFEESVIEAFSFVETEGLKLVQRSSTFVRYESADIFLNVFHGRRSFELGAEIGTLRNRSQLSLIDILLWAGALQKEGFGQHVTFQVSSRNDVPTFVSKLAQLIESYAKPFLRSDHTAFEEALAIQHRQAHSYVESVSNANIRREAQLAWEMRHYATVVTLYRSLSDNLTPVESLRLAYSEKHTT